MLAMPKPTPEHQKLHGLAGTWFGEERLNPSPWGPGGTAMGRSICRVDVDGFFVLQDYIEEKDGRVVFRGHGVFGWDGARQKYAWFWVDSMGFVPRAPSLGTWEGDTLVFESEPDGVQRGRYTYRFTGEDSYELTIENSQDGGETWRTLMEGSYQRQ